MRLILLSTAFSVFGFIVGCASVPRPNADVCTANVLALHEKCFNLKTDYDDSGKLLPMAKPHFTQYKDDAAMLAGLHKATVIHPDDWAMVKAWINELRDAGRSGD